MLEVPAPAQRGIAAPCCLTSPSPQQRADVTGHSSRRSSCSTSPSDEDPTRSSRKKKREREIRKKPVPGNVDLKALCNEMRDNGIRTT